MPVPASVRSVLKVLALSAAALDAGGCMSPADNDAVTSPDRMKESPAKADGAAPDARRPSRRVRKPFDPIRDNGPIFVGWPAPKLAIVITGRQNGYLEPCGCAGLDRMRGGLSRRHTMLQSLRQKGWPLVLLDVGGICKRFGPQGMLKFHTSVEAMTKMGYDAIRLGTADLRFPAAEFVTLVADEESRPSRFVSANVGLFGLAAKVTPQKRIVEVAEMKLGVTSILGKKYQREINNPDVEMSDPEASLAPIPLK